METLTDLEQFYQGHASSRVSLRGLHNISVTTDCCHWEHPVKYTGEKYHETETQVFQLIASNLPEGYHCWEVEWGNAGTDAQGHLVGGQVHVFCDAWQGFTNQHVGDIAALFNNLTNW